MQGLKLLGIENYQPHLDRLLADSMPSLRAKVYEAIVGGVKDSVAIAYQTKLSKREVEYLLEDIAILGVKVG